MDGWLKDDFPLGEKAVKAERAEKLAARQIAQRVTARAARRRALQRAIGSSSVLALAVCAGVGAYLLEGRLGSAPSGSLAPLATRHSPLATPHATLPVTLEKVDDSVAVAWEGSSDSEYVVYRCNSPKFDTCSLAAGVKGTQWVDSGAETGTIVFYRVEKKA